jgi:hypothetical protein
MSHIAQLPAGSILNPIASFLKSSTLYPDDDIALFGAFSVLAAFSQSKMDFGGFGGLPLAISHLLLMPTGFGKEAWRRSIFKILDKVDHTSAQGQMLRRIEQLPSSAQALHRELEHSPSLIIGSDEIADYLLGSERGSKQGLVSYLMEATTRFSGRITPAQSLNGNYMPVDRPRISLVATATPERMTQAFSPSQADAGAYNRMVILCKTEAIKKVYDVQAPPVPIEITNFGATIHQKFHDENKSIQLSQEAKALFIELDQSIYEPEKFKTPRFAARLAEQVLKYACLVAISCGRDAVTTQDLHYASDYRLYLHGGFMSYLHAEGGIANPSNRALDQVFELVQKRKQIAISQVQNYSRAYKALSVSEQERVVKALIDRGLVEKKKVKTGYVIKMPNKEDRN